MTWQVMWYNILIYTNRIHLWRRFTTFTIEDQLYRCRRIYNTLILWDIVYIYTNTSLLQAWKLPLTVKSTVFSELFVSPGKSSHETGGQCFSLVMHVWNMNMYIIYISDCEWYGINYDHHVNVLMTDVIIRNFDLHMHNILYNIYLKEISKLE